MVLNIRTIMDRFVFIFALRVTLVQSSPVCSHIETPDHARIENTPTYEAGSTIVYKCNKGYDMLGKSTLLCRNDGEWSPNETARCDIKMCNGFGSIRNGVIFQDLSKGIQNGYGDIVHVTCNDGYVLNGSPDVMCQANGSWSMRPSCVRSPCPPYPGMNSSCIESSWLSGKFLHLICREDVSVTRTGHGVHECVDGEWYKKDIVMECYCDCQVNADFDLVSVSNAIGGYIGHTSTLEWSCKEGYMKNSTEPLVCRDGTMGSPECIKGTAGGNEVESEHLFSHKTEEGMLIGAGAGAAAALIGVGILAFCYYRIRKSSRK